jgi:hypothetical protein
MNSSTKETMNQSMNETMNQISFTFTLGFNKFADFNQSIQFQD